MRYDLPAQHVARITLARADTHNAQDTDLLYELNAVFDRAAQDDEVKVIILAADGRNFSSGHDFRETNLADRTAAHTTVGTWCGFGCAGAEGQMAREMEIYLGFSERWRNVPKPTIAAVQGKVISGGLMLVWPCDLIVASSDAVFVDNTVAMGISGAEFFNHPWELPLRVAKEMLSTSSALGAVDAFRLGMVNHVVAADQLESFSLGLAERVAEQPLFALKLAKEAVNAAQDAQGRRVAMGTSFALHQICHCHNRELYGGLLDPSFFERRERLVARWDADSRRCDATP